MKIPESFKRVQLRVFQDKTLTRYAQSTQTNSIGEVKKTTGATNGTFKANIKFDNFEQIQQEHGIRDQIDITMTTQTEIPEGEVVSYDGRFYEVFKVIKNDSHYLLVARKWLSKFSTLVSA